VSAPLATLVLLPGMDGSGDLFAGFVAALDASIAPRVLSYPADVELDYQGLVDFVRTRLPHGEPYVLLGESFSGPVAIALAAAHPPGMVGLILSCTFARNPVPLARHFSALIPFLPVSAKFAALAMPLLLGGHATPVLRRSVQGALARPRQAVLRARMRAVLGVDYSAQARSIAVPVLYLQAQRDRMVFGGSAKHLAALLPGMTVKAVDGPHLLLQAAPQVSATIVNAFIAHAVAAWASSK
jgi:pimeloyl-[acyl-carrier protein] methyl ester esterase